MSAHMLQFCRAYNVPPGSRLYIYIEDDDEKEEERPLLYAYDPKTYFPMAWLK